MSGKGKVPKHVVRTEMHLAFLQCRSRCGKLHALSVELGNPGDRDAMVERAMYAIGWIRYQGFVYCPLCWITIRATIGDAPGVLSAEQERERKRRILYVAASGSAP